MARRLSCWAGVETVTILGCGEAERPKRSRDPWVGGIERETGKRATESWKRTQREEGGAEGGMAVFMVVEKAARLVRLRLAGSGGR
jgi:hypothetical protein